MKLTLMCASAVAALSLANIGHAQTSTYLTDFAKTDNIYTNLNQQFPNTGAGVPGSSTGVPNSTFVFNPQTFNPSNPNNTDYVTNGVNFELASNATGQDFTEVGPAGFGVAALTIPVGVAGATSFYPLASAFDGTSANVTFTGSAGGAETFSNVSLPDFNGGGPSTRRAAGRWTRPSTGSPTWAPAGAATPPMAPTTATT